MNKNYSAHDIAEKLKGFNATRLISAGDARQLKSGRTRIASHSVWEYSLHEGDLVKSSDVCMSDLIIQQLAGFVDYSSCIKSFDSDGMAYLKAWIVTSRYSVEVLEPEALDILAKTNLRFSIEIN